MRFPFSREGRARVFICKEINEPGARTYTCKSYALTARSCASYPELSYRRAINFDENDKTHVVIGNLIGHRIIINFQINLSIQDSFLKSIQVSMLCSISLIVFPLRLHPLSAHRFHNKQAYCSYI